MIIAASKVSKLRNLLKEKVRLNQQSQLDNDVALDDDYNDFKDAILNNTFSDQFNLTLNKLSKLSSVALNDVLKCILDKFFNSIDENGFVRLTKDDAKIVLNAFYRFMKII